ncbi:MAG: agmatine deiminase family protein [Paramuribaculum sp.]|nr:agmatine deiminase family protein [Paramuribaculum sp.]
MNNVRFPAEWEKDCAILVAMPHENTDWHYIIDEVTECYINLIKAFAKKGITTIVVSPDSNKTRNILRDIEQSKVIYFDADTNDTWTRDYGPLTIEKNGKLTVEDFKFNGWGLKFAACHDNLVTGKLCQSCLITAPRDNRLGFVLEGGSLESDGNGTLLTTARCLESPNRNGDLSREQIESRLAEWLGIKKFLWLEYGALEGDDTDSHIDTLARIAPYDTIIYTGCNDKNDSHFDELNKMKLELEAFVTRNGNKFNLVELPLPSPIYDEDGMRLPATYANYLVTPQAIFMPVYNQILNDRTAKGILEAVFEKEVITVDCTPLIKQHGSLHCATMQIPIEALCL